MKTTYHIESYRNGRLIDINETGFDTMELALNEVKVWQEYDRNFNRRMLTEWKRKMKEELFDETSDRIPEPLPVVKYEYKIAEYVHTIFGFYTPEEYPAVVNTEKVAKIMYETWLVENSDTINQLMGANITSFDAEQMCWLAVTMPREQSTNPNFDWEGWVKWALFR